MTTVSGGRGRLDVEPLRGCRIEDLSLELGEDLPYWPTHMPFQHKTFAWFGDRSDPAAPLWRRTGGAYQTRWLLMDEHTGTHCDAPAHFVPPPDSGLPHAGPLGDLTVEKIPLAQLVGPAAVVDVSDLVGKARNGCSPRIGRDPIERFEDEHGPIREGDMVLLRSGWDRFYGAGDGGAAYARDVLVDRSTPGWPAPAAETVALLLERGVRCLGTDGASIGAADEGVEAHLPGLAAGMVYVEGLARLHVLPPRGATFVFLPIKLRGGSGGPGRAIALVPDDSAA